MCWLLSCDPMVVLWFEWLRLVLRPFCLAGGRVYLGMLHPCRVTSNLLGIPWSLLVISGVILWPLLPVNNRPFIGAPTPLVSGRGLLNGSLGWNSPYSPYKPWPSTVTERPYFLSITVRNWKVYMRCWICLFDLLWFFSIHHHLVKVLGSKPQLGSVGCCFYFPISWCLEGSRFSHVSVIWVPSMKN